MGSLILAIIVLGAGVMLTRWAINKGEAQAAQQRLMNTDPSPFVAGPNGPHPLVLEEHLASDIWKEYQAKRTKAEDEVSRMVDFIGSHPDNAAKTVAFLEDKKNAGEDLSPAERTVLQALLDGGVTRDGIKGVTR